MYIQNFLIAFACFTTCGLLPFTIAESTNTSKPALPILCERSPKWNIDENGQSMANGSIVPMDQMKGNVTVIALLKGASNRTIQQAER